MAMKFPEGSDVKKAAASAVTSPEWLSKATAFEVPVFLKDFSLKIYIQADEIAELTGDDRNLAIITDQGLLPNFLGEYTDYFAFSYDPSLTEYFRKRISIPDVALGEALRRQNIDSVILNALQENADRKDAYNKILKERKITVLERMSIPLTKAMMRAGYDPFVFEACDWIATHALRCYNEPLKEAELNALVKKVDQSAGLTKDKMVRGGRYKWKGKPEHMIYHGYNFSGNGYWHQFVLASDPNKIWCEIKDEELTLLEEIKPDNQ